MNQIVRHSGRNFNELRNIKLTPHFAKYADGSCLVQFGDTHVLCTASIEEKVPPFLKGQMSGWITAEYGMLPRSTHSRMDREAKKGKLSGRTMEIQRLIGRSLRAVADLSILGERQIIIDCDVLQADGGTRTASITGGWVALAIAVENLLLQGKINSSPLTDQVAAISCGIVGDEVFLDLDYSEDSTAKADANFVMTTRNQVVEFQATAEESAFEKSVLDKMWLLAIEGCSFLFKEQLNATRQERK